MFMQATVIICFPIHFYANEAHLKLFVFASHTLVQGIINMLENVKGTEKDILLSLNILEQVELLS